MTKFERLWFSAVLAGIFALIIMLLTWLPPAARTTAQAVKPDQISTGQARMQFFRIGTGSSGGTYFPVGGLIANAISRPPGGRPCEQGGACGVPGLVAIAQSTNASAHNVTAVNAGAIEAGMTGAATLYQAYHGEGKFRGIAKRNVRIIANLYPEHMHLVLPAGVTLSSLADLKGKRVGIGQAGSGTQVAVLTALKAFGLSRTEFSAAELNMSQSAERLADGHLDAFFYTGGTPIAALIQLASTKGFSLYRFSAAEQAAINKVLPYYLPNVIKAGTYHGIDQSTPTLAVNGILITNKDQPADLIYAITKTLWAKPAQTLFERGHAKAAEIRLRTALKGIRELDVPLHPGAARYYREIGMLP